MQHARNAPVEIPPHVQAKAEWRSYLANPTGVEAKSLSIGIAASFTADTLVPMVGSALLTSGFRPDIRLGSYNQIFQTCLDYRGQFSGTPDAIVLLWRTEDLLGPELERAIEGAQDAFDAGCTRADELVRAISNLRDSYPGMIVISLPAYPQTPSSHILGLAEAVGVGHFHRVITNHLTRRLAEVANVRLLDLDALQRDFGAQAAVDPRKWYLYKQPYTEAFLFELGALLARIVRANLVASKKCLVLDCDNTLWGGIIGEDGLGGIQIGNDFPGSAFRDLQKYVLHLRSQGVLIALASKNNEDDVWEVFNRHDGMVLKREHISAWRIGWDPKEVGLRTLARELNIGLDSLVFVDDNPFEIEQVRSLCPDVTAVLLDPEPARMLEQLKRLYLFDKLDVSQEDTRRSAMVDVERHRSEVGASLSHSEFVSGLDLTVEIGLVSDAQLGRCAQLINKTNQFNLTTIRRSLEEIHALHLAQGWRIYVMRVSDRFGEYGLVGVAIIETLNMRWRLDTFLLSCRVLGRGVETAFLATIGDDAAHFGVNVLEASFTPTAKNAPAADFLPSHGFTKIGEVRYEALINVLPPVPQHVSLIGTAAAFAA